MKSKLSTTELYEFVLEQIQGVQIEKRARLCRELSLIIGTEKFSHALVSQADELDEINLKHQQLVLDFKRRAL